MLLSRGLIFCLLTCLGGCQFERVHQSQQCHASQRFSIKTNGVQGYIPYQFKRSLEANLSTWCQCQEEPYIITLDLKPERAEIGYGPDATVLRAQERLKVVYTVTRPGHPAPVYSGDSIVASSFNINSKEEFSTLIARESATERVVTTLAEEIARDIMLNVR